MGSKAGGPSGCRQGEGGGFTGFRSYSHHIAADLRRCRRFEPAAPTMSATCPCVQVSNPAQGADSHGYCPQNRLTCANQQAGPHFAAPAASCRAGGVPVMDESHAFHVGGRPARWRWRARRRCLSAAVPGLAEQPAARELEVLRLLAAGPDAPARPDPLTRPAQPDREGTFVPAPGGTRFPRDVHFRVTTTVAAIYSVPRRAEPGRRPASRRPPPGTRRLAEETTVKRIHAERPRTQRARPRHEGLPAGPRDPDIVRAKALGRAAEAIGSWASSRSRPAPA